jgi:hypothetical protein
LAKPSNVLGHGFLEKIYENAPAFVLCKAKIEVRRLGMRQARGPGIWNSK